MSENKSPRTERRKKTGTVKNRKGYNHMDPTSIYAIRIGDGKKIRIRHQCTKGWRS